MTFKQSAIPKALLFTLSLCLLPSYALAKDISNEQRNAYEARQEYTKNKSNHENLLTRISLQEERIAKEQERLNQLKTEETMAKTKLEQSKIDLDAKVRALNAVWDLRSQ